MLLNTRASQLFVLESILYLGYLTSLSFDRGMGIAVVISILGGLLTFLFASILKITRINLNYVKKKLKEEYPYYKTIKQEVDDNFYHWLNKPCAVTTLMSKWIPVAMGITWVACFIYGVLQIV